MYTASSETAYRSLHESRTRFWSVPSGPTSPEAVEPEFGGGRIFGPEVCSTLEFAPRFSLAQHAKIFTIGSCFAREVEESLLTQGFNVLTRTGDYGYAHGYLNRYNTWAMAQEIDFAIGSRQFDERSISRLNEGGYADLTSYGRFETAEEAHELRRRTTALFRHLLEADVVIITAGLSEIWYDKSFDYYTNIAPSGASLAYPDRFEFRLLGFHENHQALCRLVEDIRRIRPACNILLTVSPVPLNATFAPRDVLISNSYSKACLRTAVEELLWAYPFVDYFPSFEMVNLSDPAMVWESDYRHVKREFVERIMLEFKRRYVVAK
jgi:hypothetical protein